MIITRQQVTCSPSGQRRACLRPIPFRGAAGKARETGYSVFELASVSQSVAVLVPAARTRCTEATGGFALDHGAPVADGDGEDVPDIVGAGAGVGGAEVWVDVGAVLDGRDGVEDSIDERGESDELPDLSDEGELGTRVGAGVVGRGVGARLSVGVVTTPTRLRAGFGAGRTSR